MSYKPNASLFLSRESASVIIDGNYMDEQRYQELLQEGHPPRSAHRILVLEGQIQTLQNRLRELESQNEQLAALNATMAIVLTCFDGMQVEAVTVGQLKNINR